MVTPKRPVGRPYAKLDKRLPAVLRRYESRDIRGKREITAEEAGSLLGKSKRSFYRHKKLYLASLA